MTSASDALELRERPPGRPVMHQKWGRLLFLHWPVPPEALRPLLPEGLSLDMHKGRAWVGISPFTMWDVRARLLPALPRVSETHELNVRTYVHWNGVPGVWFLSLDASNPLAVAGARLAFGLPYYRARMELGGCPDAVHFSSRRRHPGAPPARFETRWTGGASLPPLEPGSLDFFLIERYLLFSVRRGRLCSARIHHRPWPLKEARIEALSSSMLTANGLLVHAQREPLAVEVWPPRRI